MTLISTGPVSCWVNDEIGSYSFLTGYSISDNSAFAVPFSLATS